MEHAVDDWGNLRAIESDVIKMQAFVEKLKVGEEPWPGDTRQEGPPEVTTSQPCPPAAENPENPTPSCWVYAPLRSSDSWVAKLLEGLPKGGPSAQRRKYPT